MAERNVFSEFLGKMLLKHKITLRELSRRTGIDAGNLSKIERGVSYPPQKNETLRKIVIALELTDAEATEFFDLAALVNGKMPDEVGDLKKNPAIPLLLRAVNNRLLSQDETSRLAIMIEKSEEWQGRVVE